MHFFRNATSKKEEACLYDIVDDIIDNNHTYAVVKDRGDKRDEIQLPSTKAKLQEFSLKNCPAYMPTTTSSRECEADDIYEIVSST